MDLLFLTPASLRLCVRIFFIPGVRTTPACSGLTREELSVAEIAANAVRLRSWRVNHFLAHVPPGAMWSRGSRAQLQLDSYAPIFMLAHPATATDRHGQYSDRSRAAG